MQLKVLFKMFKSLKVKTDKSIQAFFALLRAGLWADANLNLNDNQNDKVDWEKLYQLAEEQSVVGLILAGIERYKNLNIDLHLDQELLLQWIGEVQMLEQQNKAMNEFVAKLIEKLRKEDVYALLLKGQGIAQCYERPLWRASGDVDLLLTESNYKKAQNFLAPLASSMEDEDPIEKHLGLVIDNWSVELHGTQRSRCLMKMDKVIDEVQRDVFNGGNVRSWLNGTTQIFLPDVDNDVVFVFTHIIKHFFRGGIGLRQVCDWCRLLWAYRDKLDIKLLESRIRSAKLMSEWKTFAYMAVNTLGMPVNAMPFYSSSNKWRNKSNKILTIILKTGNFGHNIDRSYMSEYGPYKRKLTTMWRGTIENTAHFTIFPLDSIRVWLNLLKRGLLRVK